MRHRSLVLVGLGTLLLAASVGVAEDREPREQIAEVLNRFHQAASVADGELYFSLFADNAVFIGTDASERWSVAEFKAFAEPYFSAGRGWTYLPRQRHIDIASGGDTGWFDEILDNDAYGICRGTGVLIRTRNGWRIAQYHLTIPMPNELTRDFASRIKDFEGEALQP